MTTRKTGSFEVVRSGNTVEVSAERIGTNGWTIRPAPAGRRASSQRRAALAAAGGAIQEQSLNWIAGAATVVAAGFLLMIAWRQGYDRPPVPETPRSASPAVPDDLSPALGGVVAANGAPTLEHAMAALFALADRGEIEIEENRAGCSPADFQITRRAGHTTIVPYERRVLDLAFGGTSAPGETATLSQARSRITRVRKVSADFARHWPHGISGSGPDRAAKRYQAFGVVMLVAALDRADSRPDHDR